MVLAKVLGLYLIGSAWVTCFFCSNNHGTEYSDWSNLEGQSVESALWKQGGGTQRRINMKRPHRDVEIRQTSHRCLSPRGEGVCLGAQLLRVEVSILVFCAWLWSQGLPGDLRCARCLIFRAFYSSHVQSPEIVQTLCTYCVERVALTLICNSKWSTTQIPKYGSELPRKMLGYTDHYSTSVCSEMTWCLLISNPVRPLIITVTPKNNHN